VQKIDENWKNAVKIRNIFFNSVQIRFFFQNVKIRSIFPALENYFGSGRIVRNIKIEKIKKVKNNVEKLSLQKNVEKLQKKKFFKIL